MKRTITIIALVAAVLASAGCGASQPEGWTEASLAKSVVAKYVADGDSLTGLTCVKRADHVYRCLGDYKIGLVRIKKAIIKEYGAAVATPMNVNALAPEFRENDGPFSLEVTTSGDTWISGAVPGE